MKKLFSVLGLIVAFCAVFVIADCTYRFLTKNCRKYIDLNK